MARKKGSRPWRQNGNPSTLLYAPSSIQQTQWHEMEKTACVRASAKTAAFFPSAPSAAIYMTWFPKYFLDALFSQGNGKPFVSASWICHIGSACSALSYGTDIHSSFIRGGVTWIYMREFAWGKSWDSDGWGLFVGVHSIPAMGNFNARYFLWNIS